MNVGVFVETFKACANVCVCVCKTESMAERVCERVRVHVCMSANVCVCACGVLILKGRLCGVFECLVDTIMEFTHLHFLVFATFTQIC